MSLFSLYPISLILYPKKYIKEKRHDCKKFLGKQSALLPSAYLLTVLDAITESLRIISITRL